MKRIIIPALILLISLSLCGFLLVKNKPVVIDTANRRVYRYISADGLTDSAGSFSGQYVAVFGKVSHVSINGEEITVSCLDRDGKVRCRCDKSIRGDAAGYGEGSMIAVYGKYTSDNAGSFVAAEKLSAPLSGVMSPDVYCTYEGKVYDYSASLERTLGGGRVTYRIPPSWKEVEVDIRENDLGSMEGYQYVLNKMTGSSDSTPESLFVCYFDKNLLMEKGDITKTDLTAKAIVKNIEGKADKKFPYRRENTYYGADYRYYHGKYNDITELGKGYRTEYVFIPDGDRGMVVLLYFYRDDEHIAHISDVMFTARFLK